MPISRILILYANYGEGHKKAAKAIENQIHNQSKDVEIIMSDFLGDQFPLIDAFMRKLYIQSFTWAKPFYKKLYYKTKDLPYDASVASLFTKMGSYKLEKFIRELKIDIVISTFPALTGMLSQIKKRNQTKFKLNCLVTDYTTHNHWLYQYVDHYFVPTEQIKQEFIARGIPEDTIQATGIPVLSKFEEPHSKEGLREKWGLPKDKPIVLLSAGAFGVVNVKDSCQELIKKCPNAEILVVCGRNKKLYNSLLGLKSIHPLPYTDKMHELLKLSDLFITKAGGLSVSEAITCEVPMVLFKSLPGQETENVKFLIKNRAARRAKTSGHLSNIVHSILNNERTLHKLKENIKRLHKMVAHSEIISETVLKELQGDLPHDERNRDSKFQSE